MNFTRYEYFDLKYPSSLPQTCIDAMRHLSDRLNDEWFASTFLPAQHFLRTLLEESKAAAGKAGTNRIVFTFQTSAEYNQSLSLYEMNAEDDEPFTIEPANGWFDPRVHPRQLYINFDYYEKPARTENLLFILCFSTAVHELQHCLMYHSSGTSPTSPFVSLYDDEDDKTESGDYIEEKLFGGRVGVGYSTDEFKVEALYLMYVNEDHKEEDGWMGSPYITNLEALIIGQITHPLSSLAPLNASKFDASVGVGLSKGKLIGHPDDKASKRRHRVMSRPEQIAPQKARFRRDKPRSKSKKKVTPDPV
ncbi:hypothetical protein HK097_009357 [Rhizophlyctis rosea]|uniref:Uncharacterized protein n=1 Tax=Rhizophlyctis rosea TaxID=64517 RepID=A0AAD5SC49_9FUNG|nr:hypothetical protein HK097_009357 [Rhizophlyctis rosea]